MTFASSPLSLKLLLILSFLKALIDTAVWINGAAHINIWLAILAFCLLVWYFRVERKRSALIALLLLTFSRALINIIIILPSLEMALSVSRLIIFNLLFLLTPAILGIFVLLDWKKLEFSVLEDHPITSDQEEIKEKAEVLAKSSVYYILFFVIAFVLMILVMSLLYFFGFEL